jgi:hypothetical protein
MLLGTHLCWFWARGTVNGVPFICGSELNQLRHINTSIIPLQYTAHIWPSEGCSGQ